jgi:hypothetical protein
MHSRFTSAVVSPLLAAGLVVLIPVVVGAAQREHSGTETFAAPDGTRVVIDAATVDIRLRSADVPELEIATELRISGVGEEKAERFIADHTPKTEITDGRITVTIKPGHSGFLGFGTLTARTRVAFLLPGHVIPDVTTTSGSITIRGDFPDAHPLYLRSATGDIELTGATAAVDIRTASGDTRLDLIRPVDRVYARTSSGSVSLSGGAREVNADTASGSVWMTNLSGDANVATSTGKITLSWDHLEQRNRVVVQSDSAQIRLTIPEGTSPRGSLSTIGGTLRSDFPGVVSENGDTITLTGDGPEFLVDSASGNIVLEAGTWWGGTADGTDGK